MLDIYNGNLVANEAMDDVNELEIVGNVHFEKKVDGRERLIDRANAFLEHHIDCSFANVSFR